VEGGEKRLHEGGKVTGFDQKGKSAHEENKPTPRRERTSPWVLEKNLIGYEGQGVPKGRSH